MSTERHPSLTLIFEELTGLLDRQSRHVDALDSKASIVIGFTAVVLGVTVGQRPHLPSTFVLTGVGFGAIAFGFAVWAFWVRRFTTLPRPREFLLEFANVEEEQSRLVLCNLAVASFERNAPTAHRKALALKLSLLALSGSVATFVVGFIAEGVR